MKKRSTGFLWRFGIARTGEGAIFGRFLAFRRHRRVLVCFLILRHLIRGRAVPGTFDVRCAVGVHFYYRCRHSVGNRGWDGEEIRSAARYEVLWDSEDRDRFSSHDLRRSSL